MCEFCLDPTGKGNRDQFHPSFQGFFSAEAIDVAVRQANASRQQHRRSTQDEDAATQDDDDDNGDADSDGT